MNQPTPLMENVPQATGVKFTHPGINPLSEAEIQALRLRMEEQRITYSVDGVADVVRVGYRRNYLGSIHFGKDRATTTFVFGLPVSLILQEVLYLTHTPSECRGAIISQLDTYAAIRDLEMRK